MGNPLRDTVPRRRRRLVGRRFRRLHRRCFGWRLRWLIRGGRRRGNYLSQALAAFGQAIRASRKLSKLAPDRFDVALLNRRARERAEADRWAEQCIPALAAVYYPGDPGALAELRREWMEKQCRNSAEIVQFSSAKEQVIEGWLLQGRMALELGEWALARHQRLRSHQRVGLSRVARLCESASMLGRLAVGLPVSGKAAP
jgi:hypothetical protein